VRDRRTDGQDATLNAALQEDRKIRLHTKLIVSLGDLRLRPDYFSLQLTLTW